jgi:hypothetical protein
MRTLTGVVAALCLSALFGVFSPKARADDWNRKTIVTFNEPVEIPGRVLLPGTYVFRLVDDDGDRNMVQIFTENEMHLIATIFATPAKLPEPPSESIFSFEQRSKDSPEALKTWFYPGFATGLEFEYSNP